LVDEFGQQVESQLKLTDYLRIIYRGRWIILTSFLIVFAASIYYTYITPMEYEASTTIIIESTGAMERSIFEMSYFGNQNTLIANQMEILKSRSLAERVVKRLDLSDVRDSLAIFQPNEKDEYASMREMIGIIQHSMEMEHKRDTDIITLTFSAGSPFEAAYISNVIAEEFQLMNAETNRSELTDLRRFIEDQLSKKWEELRASEERLREYQEKEHVASLDAETSELVTRLAEVESVYEQAQVELESNLEMKRSLEDQLDKRQQTMPKDLSEISTPYLLSLQTEIARAVAERTSYITALQAEGQTVNKQYFESTLKQYDDKIAALKQKLLEEANNITRSGMVKDPLQISQELIVKLLNIETEIKSSTAKINALQEVVSEYNAKMENLPVKVLELARLERRRKVDEQTYMMMTEKLEETKIQEAAQSRNVHIIDEAIEPLFPVKPKVKLNLLLGALIGLGLGVGATFLMEYFDNSVKTPEELERMGFNILATIPKIEMDRLERKIEQKMDRIGAQEGRRIESRLITHLDPKSPVSEAYRTLRTNLQFSKIDRKLRSMLVTSAGPKEGKSTTIANLAIAMAQIGQRVVVVDADLRRPIIHSIFALNKDEGLTNYLMDAISYEQMIKPSILDNLYVITSGILPPNPSELLASDKMQRLIEKLCEEFDIVLFDSPPVIAVTDAAILSTKLDGTILVISSGQTSHEALNRANTLLANVNSRMLGVLLNGVDVQGMYGSYYYYYYHHYYSKPGKSKKRKRRSKGLSS
jgi:tyrosine-protein kinase Etk/Wzc